MRTHALRIYGRNDLRLETFDLPDPKEDEILAEIVTDSVCMSSHKAAKLGPDHERVPNDVGENPTIIGHEFAGYIRNVGPKWSKSFKAGQKFTVQPALCYKGSLDAPGYSFRHIGGMAGHVIMPACVMEMNCLLPYEGRSLFKASLSEPMSCVIGACHAQHHARPGSYEHAMGIVENGNCALMGGAGPMGMGCIDYLVHGPRRPRLLVVADIDQARLDRAAGLLTLEDARRNGVRLNYINTANFSDPVSVLRSITDGRGYDDVFVFVSVQSVVEQADALLRRDGCLNVFAGPLDADFRAKLNLYNVHYAQTHVVGTSGGNTDDMREALRLMAEDKINPAAMVTHVGGITCGRETILNLPGIPGGKKLIYTQLDLPLTAIEDFAGLAGDLYGRLAEICGRHSGLWNDEAEQFLIEHAPRYEH